MKLAWREIVRYIETHDYYPVRMEYAVVSKVGDEMCIAEAAAY